MLVLGCVALLFAQAPHGGAFYWSDSPRHALNGVFVMDLIKAMPLDDPTGYAYRYYAQYPALTILFYPPLFYAISAPFYAVLGVSHETALLVVALHCGPGPGLLAPGAVLAACRPVACVCHARALATRGGLLGKAR